MDKFSGIPKGVIRISKGFKIYAYLFILMGWSSLRGVASGEMTYKGGILTLFMCGAIGVFFIYLSGQILLLKKWAWIMCLALSLIFAIIFSQPLIFGFFTSQLLQHSTALFQWLPYYLILFIPAIFFYISLYYLTRPMVMRLFK